MTSEELRVWSKHNVMDRLIGLKAVGAARSHGSMFLLHLGEWWEEFAAGKLRRYGSWCIMVERSSWQLAKGGVVVCSSNDSHDQIETGLSHAEKLAELFGPTLGGWSQERDAPFALSLVSPGLEAQLPVGQPSILPMIEGQRPLFCLFG